MEVTATDDMTAVLRECLTAMDGIEAHFIEECYLADPKTALKTFAAQNGLSPKQVSELRTRAMSSLKERLAAKNIQKIGDVA
jgi:hypothetical protein